MRPEARIEKTTCREAVRDGWRTLKLSFIGVRGAPDRMFGRDGRAVLIEFKAPGEQPTRQQLLRHEELAEVYGFEVYWVDNLDDAREILDLKKEEENAA